MSGYSKDLAPTITERYEFFRRYIFRAQCVSLVILAVMFAVVVGFSLKFALLPVLFLVFGFGAYGGVFSLTREAHKNLRKPDGISFNWSAVGVFTYVFSGGFLAVCFLFLLVSGLIGNDGTVVSSRLLPEVQTVGNDLSPSSFLICWPLFSVRDFSLLAVWAILCGYSRGAMFGVVEMVGSKMLGSQNEAKDDKGDGTSRKIKSDSTSE